MLPPSEVLLQLKLKLPNADPPLWEKTDGYLLVQSSLFRYLYWFYSIKLYFCITWFNLVCLQNTCNHYNCPTECYKLELHLNYKG